MGEVMVEQIKIRHAEGKWVVRAGGAVLAESSDALELVDGDNPFVVYFPREDVAMMFLDQSDSKTSCAERGDATYYSIVTKSTTIKDAGWSYENPPAPMKKISGYLAFHATDKVAVEQL